MEEPASQVERATRVAIASSIYMRRSSLDLRKQVDTKIVSSRKRQSSYGCIVKNNKKLLEQSKPQMSSKKQQTHERHRAILDQKLNTLESIRKPESRKTPVFGVYENHENHKIKAIEQKYSKMLKDYEEKKKAISKEIACFKGKEKGKQQPQPIFNKLKENISTRWMPDDKMNMNMVKKDCIQIENRQMGRITKKKKESDKCEELQQKKLKLIEDKISRNEKQINSLNEQKVNVKQIKLSEKYEAFFNALRQQISVEGQLRAFKQIISSLESDKLKKQIKDQTPNLILLSQEQSDPFFVASKDLTKRYNQSTPSSAFLSKLSQLESQCDHNWSQTKQILTKQAAEHIFTTLNFQKQDQISLKIFVREMSLIFEKNYRTRDFYAIYSRLKPMTVHNFTTILGTQPN